MARSWASRLAPAAIFQFCFIGAVAMVKPATNALVLSRYQAAVMPWLYLTAAVVTGGLALAGSRWGRRGSPERLAVTGVLASLAFLAGLRLDVPLTPLAAYLFVEAFATQVSLSFWGVMGDAFDAREARRAFTWVNGIGMSGAIVGGFLAQVAARTAGAPALLAGGAGLLGAGAVAFRFHRAEASPPRPAQSVLASVRTVVELPYASLLAGLVLGFSLIQQLTDFVFRQRAVELLGEADMADVFASHQLWTGVFCVVFQLVAAEWLLRRLGILRYVAVVPALLAVLAVLAGVWASVWGAWALKLFESAASWSLLPVAVQLLYAPLPDEQRDGVRRTIDGLLRKVGMGLAGLVLAVSAALGLWGVLGVVLATCAALGWVLWRIRPRYLEALHLRVGGPAAAQANLVGSERELLGDVLRSPSPERALRAAELLDYAGALDESHVRTMLSHHHERVQTRGVRLAERLSDASLARGLEVLVQTGARRPRDAAAWALGRCSPERARAVLPALLASDDVGLSTAAVGGLLTLKGEAHPQALAVLERLFARGGTAPVAERREVARLIGRLGDPAHAPRLSRYLDDGDVTVRQVAITATGEGRHLALA
ncbi:MAG: PBS lyase, partial [Myxococcaceae bacterium]|nr:PBS lyase [Myxococcaceae bacterium]